LARALRPTAKKAAKPANRTERRPAAQPAQRLVAQFNDKPSGRPERRTTSSPSTAFRPRLKMRRANICPPKVLCLTQIAPIVKKAATAEALQVGDGKRPKKLPWSTKAIVRLYWWRYRQLFHLKLSNSR
jgi:hypothetical protein